LIPIFKPAHNSDGEVIEHPRELEAAAERLGQAQRGHNKQLAARIQERMPTARKIGTAS